MNTITWILTGVLAVVFTVSGVAKSTMSRDRLIATGQTGIAPFPMPVVRAVAVGRAVRRRRAVRAVADRHGPRPHPAGRGRPGRRHDRRRHLPRLPPRTEAVAANATLLALAAFVAASRFAALT